MGQTDSFANDLRNEQSDAFEPVTHLAACGGFHVASFPPWTGCCPIGVDHAQAARLDSQTTLLDDQATNCTWNWLDGTCGMASPRESMGWHRRRRRWSNGVMWSGRWAAVLPARRKHMAL